MAKVDTTILNNVHRVSLVNSVWTHEFRRDSTIRDSVEFWSSTDRVVDIPYSNEKVAAILGDLRFEPFGNDTIYSLLCMSGEHNKLIYRAGTDSLVVTFRPGKCLKLTIAGLGHRATLTKSAIEVLETLFRRHLGVDLWGSERCE